MEPDTQPEPIEVEVEAKPVGPATVVNDEPMIEQFPTYDEADAS